jgi:carbon storage regulator CsrA
MIHLARYPGESLMVGNDRRITLVSIEGETVQLQLYTGPNAADWRADQRVALHVGDSHPWRDGITVSLVHNRGDAARVGVDAPPGVSIHRLEVYEEIARAQGPQ